LFLTSIRREGKEYRQTCQTAGKSGKYIQMHGHPTLGVKNAKPRLSRNLAPKLASALRQAILNVPQTWCRRLIGLNDAAQDFA
jgi:hypothetical protein